MDAAADPLLPPGHVGRGMPAAEFLDAAAEAANFITDYYSQLNGDTPPPVRAAVTPHYLRPRLPPTLPDTGQSFASILADVHAHIMPGITHWQHPSFFAFFPANPRILECWERCCRRGSTPLASRGWRRRRRPSWSWCW